MRGRQLWRIPSYNCIHHHWLVLYSSSWMEIHTLQLYANVDLAGSNASEINGLGTLGLVITLL